MAKAFSNVMLEKAFANRQTELLLVKKSIKFANNSIMQNMYVLYVCIYVIV